MMSADNSTRNPSPIGGELTMSRVRKPTWHLVFVLYASEETRLSNGSIITQECIYLVEASTSVEAFNQALIWASPRQLVPIGNGESMELPLLGITEVMPIWESLEHGNELGYRDGESESWDELKSAIMQIEDLSPSPCDAPIPSPGA